MPSFLVTLLAFAAGFSAIFAVNLILTDLFRRDLKDIRERLQFEEYERQRERARRAMHQRHQGNLGELAEEAFRESNERRDLRQALDELLQQSGVRMTVRRLLLLMGCSGMLAAATTYLLTRGGSLEALLVGFLGASLPLLHVQMRRKQRIEALRGQLADSLELMSRTLRAGQTITQAMQAVATELKPPVAVEFGYCFEQQRLGLEADVALRELARRTGLLEIKIFVLAVLVHRQSGGSLTELLDKLATILRERFKLRGKIKALTSEGRLQALMLLGLPPAMFGAMYALNRDYAMQHFEHPSLLVGTLISMSIGALWIRRIINFEF